METIYFNKFEFNKAYDLLETNPIKAKELLEEYLEKYPLDYSAYPYYSSTLVTLGDFESGEKILDYLKEKIEKEENFKKFIKNPEKKQIFEQNLYFSTIKLLCYQKKYQELYDVYKKKQIKLKNRDLGAVWFFVKKQLGKIDNIKRNDYTYLFRQIIEYKESDFKDHIKKHLSDNNDNIDSTISSVFVPNFPINDVLFEIKKYIPSEKRLLWGFFDDIYYFKYDGCGRVNNKLVNYFKVVCLTDTKDIITICPVSGSDDLPYIDLNYMIKEDDTKVKRISQIDKFKNRYKMQ